MRMKDQQVMARGKMYLQDVGCGQKGRLRGNAYLRRLVPEKGAQRRSRLKGEDVDAELDAATFTAFEILSDKGANLFGQLGHIRLFP